MANRIPRCEAAGAASLHVGRAAPKRRGRAHCAPESRTRQPEWPSRPLGYLGRTARLLTVSVITFSFCVGSTDYFGLWRELEQIQPYDVSAVFGIIPPFHAVVRARNNRDSQFLGPRNKLYPSGSGEWNEIRSRMTHSMVPSFNELTGTDCF